MKILSVITGIILAATAITVAPAASAAPDGCYVTFRTVKADNTVKLKLTKSDLRKVRYCAKANQGGGILDVLVNKDSSSSARYFADLVVKAFVKTGGCSLIVNNKGYQRSNCNVIPTGDDPSGQTPALTVTVMTEH